MKGSNPPYVTKNKVELNLGNFYLITAATDRRAILRNSYHKRQISCNLLKYIIFLLCMKMGASFANILEAIKHGNCPKPIQTYKPHKTQKKKKERE